MSAARVRGPAPRGTWGGARGPGRELSVPAGLLPPGGDLHYHLSQHGVFSEADMRFYAAEIILGLEHMHNRFVVYRDLKVRCQRTACPFPQRAWPSRPAGAVSPGGGRLALAAPSRPPSHFMEPGRDWGEAMKTPPGALSLDTHHCLERRQRPNWHLAWLGPVLSRPGLPPQPANILLDEHGHVRISDLGLACDFSKKKPHASV